MQSVSSIDRLQFTLLIAVGLHLLLILGLGFQSLSQSTASTDKMLDIVLLQTRNQTRPEQADYLAPKDQQGGGEQAEMVRPSAPFTAAELHNTDGIAPQPMRARQTPVEVKNDQAITLRNSSYQVEKPESKPDEILQQSENITPFPYDMEIARLTAELNTLKETYAKRPKKMVLTANTRAYLPAQYMHAWVSKMEAIGNSRYTNATNNLEGNLLLEVEIRWDGELVSTRILRSSGHAVLDAAAIEIVKSEAPFTRFPPELRAETDHIQIVRTWQFSDGSWETK